MSAQRRLLLPHVYVCGFPVTSDRQLTLEEELAAAAGELTPHAAPASLPPSPAFWCPCLAVLGDSGIMYQSPARSLCSALSTLCCAPCTTTASSSSSSLLLLRSPVPVKRALSPPALLGSSSSAAPRCGCCHQGASAGQCSAAVGPGVASSRAGECLERSGSEASMDGMWALERSNPGQRRLVLKEYGVDLNKNLIFL